MDPSKEEKVLLEQLIKRTKDLDLDNDTLLRFLRARDGDVAKAEEMIRNSVEWRKVNRVDSLRSWEPPQALVEDFIINYLGEDYDGYPVFYVPLGRWNVRDRINDGYLEEIYTFRITMLEYYIEKHIKMSKRDKLVIMFDLHELSFYKCAHMETMNAVIKIFQDFESNYPERIKSIYIVNAPWVFPYAFNIIKPFIAAKTLAKAQIFDGNRSKWLSTVSEFIPKDKIPEQAYLHM